MKMRYLVLGMLMSCQGLAAADSNDVELPMLGTIKVDSQFALTGWKGPRSAKDRIAVVDPQNNDKIVSAFFTRGSTLTNRLRAPQKPGNYQIAYLDENGEILVRVPVSVVGK